MADKKEKLFSDFSPVSTEQWMEKVTADLKGADFEKKLVWKTNEGFKVKPFYRMEDLEGLKTTDALPGEFPYLRGTKKDNNTSNWVTVKNPTINWNTKYVSFEVPGSCTVQVLAK